MNTPLGTAVDLRADHTVLDGFPVLRERGTAPLPLLGPCLLWPRSPISATPELLFKLSTVQRAKVCRQAKTSGDRSKNYIFIVCRLKRVKMHQCTKYHSDSLTIAKLWWFNRFFFQNGVRPPSWICKNWNCYSPVGFLGPKCVTMPSFVKIDQMAAIRHLGLLKTNL